MNSEKNDTVQRRVSPVYLRRRRGFIIALLITIAFIYCLPFANLFFQYQAHSFAYEKHVTPQIKEAKDVIELNSRLLPRFKFENLGSYLDLTQPALFWVGNSTQFHIRREYLERGFGCKIPNFYNMSYHSPDPDDVNRLLQSVSGKLPAGSTVVFAVYPEMFTHFARVNAPSLVHPWSTIGLSWRSLELWFRNIKDGNASFSSLFTNFIKIEWPLERFSNFPFITYYLRLLDLINEGYADEFVFADGSVEFIGAAKRNQERNARDEKIYFDHHVFARHAESPISEHLFDSFSESIELLAAKNINILAFEVVLHPKYNKMRKIHRQRKVFESTFKKMQGINEHFYFYPREVSFIEVPDRLWLDETHVTFEGGQRIAAHHGSYMKRDLVC